MIKNYKDFIKENKEEIEDLLNNNYILKDKYSINNYNLYLFYGKIINDSIEYTEYILGLNFDENKFTSAESQIKKPNFSYSKIVFESIINKIKQWLELTPTLIVGTFNKERINRYYSLINKMGFNTTEIETIIHDNKEHYLFEIIS